jgi:predicted transcriptional regulator
LVWWYTRSGKRQTKGAINETSNKVMEIWWKRRWSDATDITNEVKKHLQMILTGTVMLPER